MIGCEWKGINRNNIRSQLHQNNNKQWGKGLSTTSYCVIRSGLFVEPSPRRPSESDDSFAGSACQVRSRSRCRRRDGQNRKPQQSIDILGSILKAKWAFVYKIDGTYWQRSRGCQSGQLGSSIRCLGLSHFGHCRAGFTNFRLFRLMPFTMEL